MQRNPVINKSDQAQALEDFRVSQALQRLRQKWALFKKEFYAGDAYQQYAKAKQTLEMQVCQPVSSVCINAYNELPPQATKIKFGLIENFTFGQRLVFLNFLALGSAVFTMRKISRFNAPSLSVKSLRNSALTYMFGGLFIAPEIYNPVMMKWKQVAIRQKEIKL